MELRACANSLLEIFNRHYTDLATPPDEKTVESVKEKLLHVWTTYFSGGRINEATDKDVIGAICRIPFSHWPESIAMEVYTEFTRIMGRPVITTVNTHRTNEESRYLLKYAGDDTSQSGENGIIEQIFKTIGTQNKWCVEFGAWDGIKNSNTHSLVGESDWHGVLIEGHENRFLNLRKTYEGNDRANLFNEYVAFDETKNSLDYLLGCTDIPQDYDLMIVDIDGNDWHVWNSLKNYRPRVVIIEHNPTIANDILFIQERNKDVQQGCSLRALVMLGKEKGYELICTTNYNGIFVVKEEFEKFDIADNSIDAMHVPLMDGHIFHCYDSSVHCVGMPRLIWDWDKKGADWAIHMPDWFTVYDR